MSLYKTLEEQRQSIVLVYFSGDRGGLETQMAPEVTNFFINHLDKIGQVKKLSLYFYTTGGIITTAWSLVNLIRQFCDEFEVIVPSKCLSAGTLLCLGADSIMMTKQATLGPIDPSVNGPLNPLIPGAPPQSRAPVSVEAINGFIEFAREAIGGEEEGKLQNIILTLANQVHPLVLGNVYRTRSQIKMLARKLLAYQLTGDDSRVEKILSFLCSESGSHDYTIGRREARDELGLKITKPTPDEYGIIKEIYDNLSDEIQLTLPYNPQSLLGANPSMPYSLKRAFIESREGGSHFFVSEGELHRNAIPATSIIQQGINDNRSFEGWRYQNV